ncbi:MAG: hypothetical protein AAF609_08115 [Cyanobacteria bacterium P01_C01_bin.120]
MLATYCLFGFAIAVLADAIAPMISFGFLTFTEAPLGVLIWTLFIPFSMRWGC